MEEKDTVSVIAGAAIPKQDEWKSPFITVNGKLLTTEEYRKNPKEFNSAPIPQPYLNQVYQSLHPTLITKLRIHIPNPPAKKKENP